MKKIILTLLCLCALTAIQSCQKNLMDEAVKKLQNSKPETIHNIDGHKTTLTIVTLCDDGYIGNLEQPHANLFVAENAKFFRKISETLPEMQDLQVKLIYKSKTNGDEQEFEYTTEELKSLTENPEKTIQEAQKELALIEEI